MVIKNTKLKYAKKLIPLNLDNIKFLVVHHIEADHATPEQIHKWHLENGWNGAGYNEYIQKDGTVWILRGDHIGAQSHGNNSASYGIALEGNYQHNSDVPREQYNALIERLKFHKARMKDPTIVPHSALNSTDCPGRQFPIGRVISDVERVEIIEKEAEKKILVKKSDLETIKKILYNEPVLNKAHIRTMKRLIDKYEL